MPSSLKIKIYVDGNTRDNGFKEAAHSAQALQVFLQSLDGVKTPTLYVAVYHSKLTPDAFPLVQDLIIQNEDQAIALAG